ncbi:MAG: ATP-binding cassette domain-containing protein, partial [Actinobacteria bacterium]
GILAADSGSVRFEGSRITGMMPHRLTRLGIGRTFQITRALGEMTVLENMVVGSPARGWRAAFGSKMLDHEVRRAMDLLDFVGIAKLAREPANTLSYGQRKLLEFASVLMSEPRLVMLDEPAGGVNPTLLERIVDRIRRLNSEGMTFLIVEHNMDLVMSLSDTIVVMAHGEVLTHGTPEQVQRDGRVLDAYLGRA